MSFTDNIIRSKHDKSFFKRPIYFLTKISFKTTSNGLIFQIVDFRFLNNIYNAIYFYSRAIHEL